MEIRFKKAVIIGPGLIGGSIGYGLLQKKIAHEVVGVARKQKTLSRARAGGMISSGTTSLRAAVRGADLVVIAVPVFTAARIMSELSALVDPACLIFDVASAKQELVSQARTVFPPKIRFVGTHPLAGSEKSGPENARSDLFKNSICFITPDSQTSKSAVRAVTQIWRLLGSRPICVSPQEHDRIVAMISHLPHLIAVLMMNTVDPKLLNLSGSGFRDVTRVAAGEVEMWNDIFLSNRHSVLEALATYETVLREFKQALRKKDSPHLTLLLEKAARRRRKLA